MVCNRTKSRDNLATFLTRVLEREHKHFVIHKVNPIRTFRTGPYTSEADVDIVYGDTNFFLFKMDDLYSRDLTDFSRTEFLYDTMFIEDTVISILNGLYIPIWSDLNDVPRNSFNVTELQDGYVLDGATFLKALLQY